jgi:hypothetical protein
VASTLRVRVSSVLKRNVKAFGPAHMFADPAAGAGASDACWNSDAGSPQWVQLEFEPAVAAAAVALTFQGGFVGQDVQFLVAPAAPTARAPAEQEAAAATAAWVPAGRAEPDDVNDAQYFALELPAGVAAAGVRSLRVVFNSSTDFYGRVTVYKLDVLARAADA